MPPCSIESRPIVTQVRDPGLSGQSTASTVAVQTYSKAIYDQSQSNVWAAPTTASFGAQSLPLTLTLAPWSMNVVIIH